MRYPTRTDDGASDVINQLVLDQVFAIPNGFENFPYYKPCGGVVADEFERFLVFSWGAILQPENPATLAGSTGVSPAA